MVQVVGLPYVSRMRSVLGGKVAVLICCTGNTTSDGWRGLRPGEDELSHAGGR
jgi:hypothetical protein